MPSDIDSAEISSRDQSLKAYRYNEFSASPSSDASLKRSRQGILLEPQPSEDLEDPLNWSLKRKICTLLNISFAAFAGGAVGMCNQFGINVQAAVYHMPPIHVSYSAAAGAVGIATAPFLWVPLSNYFGRTSIIFWTQIAGLGMCIWSSQMSGVNDFVPFTISRWLACSFCSASFTVGGGLVHEIFFLHQHGKAYATYTAFFILGAFLSGTLSGFIVGTAPWPVQFYWVSGVLGASVLLVFFFLEDTTFDRKNRTTKGVPSLNQSFLPNRFATLLPGHLVVARPQVHKGPFDGILIGVQPVTIVAGVFLLITTSWAVPVQTLVGVYLQLPKAYGGYGFGGVQIACFSFISWIAIAVSETYGLAFNDRIPLWLCRRQGGLWKLEFRLYPLLLPPLLLLPFALGLFGASLQYSLTYWALGLAFFFITFADSVVLPIIITYLSESFAHHATEVFVVVNFYRFILGATVMFFFEPWAARVGYNWAFGMMAFFSILGFIGTLGIWQYGPKLRKLTWVKRLASPQEGEMLFGGGIDSLRDELVHEDTEAKQ